MKRSQDSVSASPKLSKHKKAKVAPNQVVHQAGTTGEGDGEWTRVEKRKAKKNKKVEAKHDVCLISVSFVVRSFFE